MLGQLLRNGGVVQVEDTMNQNLVTAYPYVRTTSDVVEQIGLPGIVLPLYTLQISGKTQFLRGPEVLPDVS